MSVAVLSRDLASRIGDFARTMRTYPSVAVAAAMLLVSLGVVVLLPSLPGFDPFGQQLSNGMVRPFVQWAHPLGTDPLGRDLLSRLALAGRGSAIIAVVALSLNIAVGVVLGLVAGYYGGVLESVIMGLADLQLSIPIMMLLVMVVAVAGHSVPMLILLLGLAYWVGYGRVARVVALSLRERDFVLASRTFGASGFWVLRRHLFPQLVPQLLIMGSFDLGVMVIIESGLSYLGLGVQPPIPSWGGLIAEGQDFLSVDPWLSILPGLAIWLLVGGVQIMSQHLTNLRNGRAAPARSKTNRS